ncbi:hypothetical protein AHAS_Ahas15G0222300 [Arachis hypogaea]
MTYALLSGFCFSEYQSCCSIPVFLLPLLNSLPKLLLLLLELWVMPLPFQLYWNDYLPQFGDKGNCYVK